MLSRKRTGGPSVFARQVLG